MSNAWLNFAIGVSGGFVTLIAFGSEIAQSSRLKFMGKLWFKLMITFTSLVVGIWASIQKDNISEESTRSEKISSLIEQNKRDSIAKIDLKNSIDTSSIHLVNAFTDALSKYGLKYDSAQRIITKLIKDSTKKAITIINGNDPYFRLCPSADSSIIVTEERNNKYFFKIKFCNDLAISSHISMDVFMVGVINNTQTNKMFYGGKIDLFRDNILGSNENVVSSFNLQSRFQMDGIFFLFLGKYSNSDNSKKFESNQLYYYSVSSKKSGPTNEPYSSQVRNFLLTKGVLNYSAK